MSFTNTLIPFILLSCFITCVHTFLHLFSLTFCLHPSFMPRVTHSIPATNHIRCVLYRPMGTLSWSTKTPKYVHFGAMTVFLLNQRGTRSDHQRCYMFLNIKHYVFLSIFHAPALWHFDISVIRWRPVLYFPDTEFHNLFSGQVPISSDIHVVRTFPDMSGARPSCRS